MVQSCGSLLAIKFTQERQDEKMKQGVAPACECEKVGA